MSLARRKLQKIGNSTGVVLPADVLKAAGFARGEEVIVHAERGRVTLTLLDPDFEDLCAIAESVVADHANALRKLAE